MLSSTPGLSLTPFPAWLHLAQRHLEKAYPHGIPEGQTTFTIPLDILRIGGKMPDSALDPFAEIIIEYRAKVVTP